MLKSAPKNLLPNASFELGFGQGWPNNWADMLNPLTIQLSAASRPSATSSWARLSAFLETAPMSEEAVDAPEGNRVARIPIPEGKPGHLISPVVSLKKGQTYTLSAYARSDTPSAKLAFAVWTRPVDWRENPDAQSEPLPLTNRWQRFRLTFNVASYFDQGVVDLVATADTAGNIWVDGVQLEEGPKATEFETRYPVEVSMSAKDKPFNGMLQLMGQPLEIDLDAYVARKQDKPKNLKLSIETLDGKVVFTSAIPSPVAYGPSEDRLVLDFPLVGEFRARVFSPDGEEIGVSSYGYMFTVHPVMDEHLPGILYSRDGNIHSLPAERVWLPSYGNPSHNFTITHNGMIYLMASDGETVMRSGDGGLTWDSAKVTRPMMSVLPDGTFLTWALENEQLVLYRSGDEGQSWEALGAIPGFPQHPQAGPITQLRDGTLVWPIGHPKPGVIHSVYVYRSTDGGNTWSEGYPVCPSGEPAVIELMSGRLLAVCRNNIPPPLDAWQVFLKNERWRLWQRQLGHPPLQSVEKNILLADSDDGGVTWTNVRPGSTGLDEMHGSAVELPDGRIVVIHVHRVPWLHGGEWAKVSQDGGNAWDKEIYYLSSVLTYPEYSTSCVLPPELADGKPGMILTVLGERPFGGHPGRLQAVRWRPV